MSISGDSISGTAIAGDGGAATPTAPNGTANIIRMNTPLGAWEEEAMLVPRRVFMSPFVPIQPVAPGTIGVKRVDIDRWNAEQELAPLQVRRRAFFTVPLANPQQSIVFIST
jgi:hypothetical protein